MKVFGIVALSAVLGLILIYAATRLISAAWHRSKLEAESELSAFRAKRKEHTHD